MNGKVSWFTSFLVMVAVSAPLSARAQSSATTVVIVPPPRPVIVEKTILPNPPLLATGVGTFVISYAPAIVVGIVSDHKGDDNLFIPLVGPWLDLGNRNCNGLTVASSNGPVDVPSGKTCGTSDAERIALIGDGIFQGAGVLQMVASLFIPQRRVLVRADANRPSISITPTSFGGHGAGAVAAGRF